MEGKATFSSLSATVLYFVQLKLVVTLVRVRVTVLASVYAHRNFATCLNIAIAVLDSKELHQAMPTVFLTIVPFTASKLLESKKKRVPHLESRVSRNDNL